MNSARSVAVEVVKKVFCDNAYSSIVLNKYLNKSDLNKKDRALITELVYGTLKYKYTIDCILKNFIKSNLEKMNKDILNMLRISIYQLKYLDKIPEFAVVNEAVEFSKNISMKLSKLVNGVLRNYLRNKDNLCFTDKGDKIDRICFEYSFPGWMAELFINQYGEDLGKCIMNSLNIVPKVTVRINTLKTDYKCAWDELSINGYDVKKGNVYKNAIIINKGSNIEMNPLFKKGHITVQDESAMLASYFMDVKENITVLDLCSAPGGKSCHIGELMKNTGNVYCYDLYESKLSLVRNNAERLGVKNIICKKLNATEYLEKLENTADRVLVDVPCSGLGIIRKKPEIKWNKKENSMKNLIEIQRKIILNAAKYVKTGGKLVYSTCTLNKEENEENINWFVSQNSQYKLDKLYCGEFPNIIYHKEGYMTILPDNHMDGFFIARLIKQR